MADEKIYTNIGHVTAYAYAKSKGYTGTEEQFATDQANFAANAQQVREDKESVEATVATFDNTTVPAAVQTVTAEGTRQVGIVGTAGDTQVARVQAEGTTQVGVVQTEGTTQKNAVQAKGDEVIASIPSDYTELTEEVEDLKSSIADVNDYALSAYATDTASGAIATLPDGADDVPIKQLSVAIEPVQDLHGQDAPYPAGGGVNKLPNNVTDETKTYAAVTIKAQNGVYTITGTASATSYITFDISSSVDISPSTNKIAFLNTVTSSSLQVVFVRDNTEIHFWGMIEVNRIASGWTDTGNEVINKIRFKFVSGDTYNLTVSPMLVALTESNPSAFTPYSNLCPISGHTECNVTRCGKNLFDVNSVTTGKLIGHGTGSITSNSSYLISDYIPVKAGNTYQYGEFNIWYHTLYDNNKNVISDLAITNATSAMIPNGNAKYIRISCEISKASTAFFSDTSTEYHPYQGEVYPITFPSGTGTVYGGNITVNQDGSGTLVVDKAEIQVLPNNPNLGWLDAYGGIRISIADMRCDADDPSTVVFSNIFDVNTVRGATNNTGNTFVIKTYTSKSDATYLFMCGTFTSLNEFKTWAQDKEIIIVYPLATPLAPIPLTAEHIGVITSLYGVNNFWADTGDVDVTIRADTALYIQKKIAEALA